MKILYAVQATGNGHISRAMELLPYLQHYGKVDIFLSGDNSNLALNAQVKYRSKGLSLYYNCHGGLDYWQITKAFQLSRLKKEIKELPVEKYDLVINDFEYITAAACAKKQIPSVSFGHQASFQSANCPRPEKSSIPGEWILKNYAKASRYIGLHFKEYDNFIFTPVIKKEILEIEPTDKKYVTVYLPSFCEQQLRNLLKPFTDFRFEVFCGEIKEPFYFRNIHFLPVDKTRFNKSLTHCTGIITGAGFETPAEALHLEKKLMCIPIKGQYEQICNAVALKEMGVTCLKKIGGDFEAQFNQWIQ
ncbi:MAG: glycosyltransferase family protein, partial [Bacteroidota bacterium]|nr:glycosyltransferase family protein [Bacteroidota bacterium]